MSAEIAAPTQKGAEIGDWIRQTAGCILGVDLDGGFGIWQPLQKIFLSAFYFLFNALPSFYVCIYCEEESIHPPTIVGI